MKNYIVNYVTEWERECRLTSYSLYVSVMPRRGLLFQGRFLWLFLALFLLLVVLLFTYLLECTPPADINVVLPGLAGESYGKEYYQALLQEHEDRHLSRATSLKQQIAQLKQELQEMSDKLKLLHDNNELPGVQGLVDTKDQEPGDLLEYLHSQIDKAEVNTGARHPSEYALIPFESFTSSKVYQLEMGLTRHPEEKPVRKDRRDELVEVIEAALDILNNPDEEDAVEEDVPMQKQTFTEGHFTEGWIHSTWKIVLLCVALFLYSHSCVSQDCTGQSETKELCMSSSLPKKIPATSAMSHSSGLLDP